MKKISLGIPFYNSSKYFLDCIKYSIDDDFIGEIIVNDDNSTSEEWENLNGIISNLDSSKIKVYKNEKNLGGFKNKFMTISKCSLEWVYLIDSDNSVCEDTLTTIEEKIDWDNNTCYCPESLLFHVDGNTSHTANYYFNISSIGIEECKSSLQNNLQHFSMFLNTGNFIVNRNNYIETLEEIIKTDENPHAADVIAFSYYWLKNNKKFKIVPNMRYMHRLRGDSYWNSYFDNSRLSSYYESKIKSLN